MNESQKMKKLKSKDIRPLISAREANYLSIYFPTVKAGRETAQNSVHLKNSLRKAGERLEAIGMDARNQQRFLSPFQNLLNDAGFWEHQLEGLALFRTDETSSYLRIPYPVEDKTVVANAPYLKPLLPLLRMDENFHVLVPNQSDVCLYEGNAFGIHQISPEGLPTSIEEALGKERKIKTLQQHTTRAGDKNTSPAQFHGQGGAKDVATDRSVRFYRALDEALNDFLQDRNQPLIVATTDEQFSLIKEVFTFPKLVPETFPIDSKSISDQELHEAAWKVISRQSDNQRRELVAQIESAIPQGKASTDTQEIGAAACQGRVAACIIDLKEESWCLYDEVSASVRKTDRDNHCARDLVDLIAVETLNHGGRVFPVNDKDQVPRHAAAAALLRH